jgi:hypothetical protein
MVVPWEAEPLLVAAVALALVSVAALSLAPSLSPSPEVFFPHASTSSAPAIPTPHRYIERI